MGFLAKRDAALMAARDGRAIHKWLNSITGLSGSHVVSTDEDLYYDIPEGDQVIVTALVLGLDTLSDEGHAYVAGCSAAGCGGDATELSHHVHVFSGDKKTGRGEFSHKFEPPICIKYSDGYRAVCLALAANDTDADLLAAWHGWVEDEETFS